MKIRIRKPSVNKMLLLGGCIVLIIALGEAIKSELDKSTTPLTENSCVVKEGKCDFLLFGHTARLHFSDQNIPLETQISLTVESSGSIPFEVDSAYVEGLNMFMGKNIILFNQRSSTISEGSLMIGACSEPHMRWMLSMNFRQGEKTQSVAAFFQTKWE